ncbi:hypothetical protein [Spirillospora sp. NPDC047279]|uniref:hypothetical protein n=1 Tax=Spirillospora sp. NPDC047279 TaxID=3155478 RepID=UPI0033D29E88
MANPPVVSSEGLVRVDHHVFYLLERDSGGMNSPASFLNGLVDSEEGIVAINTGIHSGSVRLRVEVCNTEPALEPAGWEDIAEVSVSLDTDILFICDSSMISNPDFEFLEFEFSGEYRVRAHAQERDAAVDLVVHDGAERHLLQFWPSVSADTVEHKISSRYGATRRRLARERS